MRGLLLATPHWDTTTVQLTRERGIGAPSPGAAGIRGAGVGASRAREYEQDAKSEKQGHTPGEGTIASLKDALSPDETPLCRCTADHHIMQGPLSPHQKNHYII